MKVTVKIDGRIYEVLIQSLDERPVLARIEDRIFEVWPDETINEPPDETRSSSDRQIRSHPDNSPSARTQDIKSPLPGNITQISIHQGDHVDKGQELLRLEAMKMVNIIHAANSGTVSKILVNVGQQVMHNDVLVTVDLMESRA